MARDPNAIRLTLDALVQPQARGRLLARGLARGMVWRDGVVPDGGPDFPSSLSADLLDFGYGVLALALELRDANRERQGDQVFETEEPFRVAAEAIESAVRRGDPTEQEQGRHLIVCAAAFHLAGFAARAFSLLPGPALEKNLSSAERALGLLLRRDLLRLRGHVVQWFSDPARSDAVIAGRLLAEDDEFGPEDAAVVALSATYHRALGLADSALLSGDAALSDAALEALAQVVAASASIGNVPMWWVAILTLQLVRDLWEQSFHLRLPSGPGSGLPVRWNDLRRDFIALLGARRPPHIDLWPSQIAAAARAADPRDDLVIALPTSAGKTRIAELCILRALADGKRTVYVTPLRALSAQLERVLARTFVPLGAAVTSLYGASGVTLVDAKTLASADVVVATPEKLDFALRQDPSVLDDVSLIVFDEGHMIGLGSREIRYEVLIQRLLRRADAGERRIVCLSAMFNPEDQYFKDFGDWLRSDEPGDLVHVRWRPTRQRLATLDWNERSGTARLSFIEGEKPFVPRFLEAQAKRGRRQHRFPKNEMEFCISAANAFSRDGHSVLVYSPQRSQVEPLVREFRHMQEQGYLDGVKAPKPEDLAVALAIGREWLGAEHPAVAGLQVGVGTHHGALPRPFLTAIEELLDRRRLPVVVASPTLAQGIDLACSVLLFRSIQRFDPETQQQAPISAAEFANVLGRAGRAYVDLDGIAVLPSFEAGSRASRHQVFEQLVARSRGQRLVSGLAQLIFELGEGLSKRLGVPSAQLLEYVLNQRDVWEDARVSLGEVSESDEDLERTLDEYLADLDVAILSLVDPLDAASDDLATLLDDVLRDSLWKRTLAHVAGPLQTLQRELLLSRAEWLWRRTTAVQRKACFYAGLGRSAGVFLHDHLDELAQTLASFHAAVGRDDAEEAARVAVALAARVMQQPFFALRKLPGDWQSVLGEWVKGAALADVLKGRKAKERQSVQAFVHEGVIFRLVWAAEAVRVQAIATNHALAPALGDGPAFALTYGVPSIPAGLLCQMGFASRVGAVWVARELAAPFTDLAGLRTWLRKHSAVLSRLDFWDSDDHRLLWMSGVSRASTDYPRRWERKEHVVAAKWDDTSPPQGTPIRILPGEGGVVSLCAPDLTPLGLARLPFAPDGVALEGEASDPGQVLVRSFGPV